MLSYCSNCHANCAHDTLAAGRISRKSYERGRSTTRQRRECSRGAGDDARLVFITHRAREADMVATLDALRHVDVVHRVGSVIRVAGERDE